MKIFETTSYADADSFTTNLSINNREYCEFIDMYPGRDLYSFTPKYNAYRNRLEKNWNYCLTYPSRNVIKNGDREFPFFYIDESGNTALNVYMFDEGTVDDDGVDVLTIYTVCQHGLLEKDRINIYVRNEEGIEDLFYEEIEIKHVIDKYTFQVKKDTANISKEWIEVNDRYPGVHSYNGRLYPVCASNRCNVDPDAQTVYFRRVVSGVECKYYVRMFSRLPNFKYKDEEVNDYTLYDDEYVKKHKVDKRVGNNSYPLSLIERFSTPGDEKCEFESHSSKLGFANTTYGDDTTEIVFTDDIDTSYLRDNLGRPLSDIYLTIVKNNKGYKEWYGIHSNIHINSSNVEYSHCFGKVNGSFLLSEFYRESYLAGIRTNLRDVRDITANSYEDEMSLFTLSNDIKLRPDYGFQDEDEIEFDNDFEYYGDICCYSPVECDEQIIQMAMHRFNTVQREISQINAIAKSYFKCGDERCKNGVLETDEIYNDEYTLYYSKTDYGDPYQRFVNGQNNKISNSSMPFMDDIYLWHTTNYRYSGMTNFREGYYYQPHYRISVKTVSNTLSQDKAIQYEIYEVIYTGKKTDKDRDIYELTTTKPNYFLTNEKLVMYKRSTNEYFYVTILEPLSFDKFSCVIADENGEHLDDNHIQGFTDIERITDYVLLKKHENTPDYAKLIKDGSCRYCWREVVSNGVENDKNVFPFTNGAFYINRRIDFFLRRQDPWKYNLGFDGIGDLDFVPDGEDIRNYPNFDYYDDDNYNVNEIEEC